MNPLKMISYLHFIFLTCILKRTLYLKLGFPGGSVVKNLSANTGDASWIPGSGRSPGGGNGNPLQYSSLGNSIDREAWQATIHGITESDRTEQLSAQAGVCIHTYIHHLYTPPVCTYMHIVCVSMYLSYGSYKSNSYK